jgi:hypothetical protein
VGHTEGEAAAVARELGTGTAKEYLTFVVRTRPCIEIGVVAVFVGSDGDPFMRGSTRRALDGSAEVGRPDTSF